MFCCLPSIPGRYLQTDSMYEIKHAGALMTQLPRPSPRPHLQMTPSVGVVHFKCCTTKSLPPIMEPEEGDISRQ